MTSNKPAAKPARWREWWGGVLFLTIIFALVGGFVGDTWADQDVANEFARMLYISAGALAVAGLGWGILGAFYWWLCRQFGGIGGGGY